MTDSAYLLWFTITAVALVAILVVGTLSAAQIPLPGRRKQTTDRDRERARR